MTLLPSLLRAVEARGHVVFRGEIDVNVIGQRGPSRRAGELDDLISVVWFEGGSWREVAWPCSTDPGRHFLARPMNPRGTAILAPGQYRGAYTIGLHKQDPRRPALVQTGPVSVFRDQNRDEILDIEGPVYPGLHGINIHDDAGVGAEASAGCTVLKRAHLDELLAIVRRSTARYGPRVSYTLIEV